VVPAERGQVNQELIRDVLSVPHFRKGFLKIDRVPENNGGYDQVEAGSAIALVLE